jgi:hypothetical protein
MIYDDVDAYPLSWPATWPRTIWHQRKKSNFAQRSLAAARDFVLDELRLLGAKSVIISTNIELRRDGLPRSGRRSPDDPGAAVYFTLKGEPRVLACDRWRTVEDNLWAIGLDIEAQRGRLRWGVGTLEMAFMGYPALPAAMPWWDVLGVDRGASLAEIQSAYRHRARETHPDAGGSQDDFVQVQAAFEAAKIEKGGEG